MRLPLPRDLAPAPDAGLPVLGFVVVVTGAGGRSWLTNADLSDLETAEHEARTWRRSAAGEGFRYQVCTVTGGAR